MCIRDSWQAARGAQVGRAAKTRGMGLPLQGWSLVQADIDDEEEEIQVAELARVAQEQGGCSAVVGVVLLSNIPDVYDTGWGLQVQM